MGIRNAYFAILHFCLQLNLSQNHSNPHREDFYLFCLLSMILELLCYFLYQAQKQKGKQLLEENKWMYFS